MSKDEYDHLTIRRTRHGTPQGDAVERTMLDALNDTGSFRSRYRDNADGSVTRMKTKGGMPEFVTEDGPRREPEEGLCQIALDSGIVDLQAADFLGSMAGAHDSGFLWATDYVAEHIAANDDVLASGPVLGQINPPEFKGSAFVNGEVAKSFERTDTKDPYNKKRVSIMCPPSIFTGKMRTYVQALYGLHDHGDMFMLVPPSGATPSVYFDHTGRFGNEEDPAADTAVLFHTNCGIFTDPETCKHYLISITSDTIKIYALKATKCGEKLRKKLKDDTVSLGDKVKIEAYILSQSHPDTTEGRVVTLTGFDLPTTAMGYGWHFSYDGTKCDLVRVDYVGTGENRSIHYRLNFTFNRDTGFWNMNPTVVEGPVQWKHRRHDHVIAFPHWSYTGMEKLGENSPASHYGNAPFYVFYKKDSFNEAGSGTIAATMASTAQVCRYSATTTTIPKGADRSPEYTNPNNGLLVFGSDPVSYAYWEAHDSTVVSMTCGEHAVSETERVVTKGRQEHFGATPDMGHFWGPDAFFPGLFGSGEYSYDNGQGNPSNCYRRVIGNYYEGDINVCSQVITQKNQGPYEQVTGNMGDVRLLGHTGASQPATWTEESFTANETYTARFVTLAPFDDAEALYISGYQYRRALETGLTRNRYGGTFFQPSAVRPFIGANWVVVAVAATLGGPTDASILSSESFTNRVNEYDPEEFSIMVSGYGAEPAETVPSAAAFFDPTDDISPVIVGHKSSASGKAGKSIDVGVEVDVGPVDLEDRPFTFVGWA